MQANGRLRSNDWNAVLRAVQEGFGITLGPESVLEPEIQAGRLVRLLPDYEGPARPMHVLTSAARRPTASLRSFVEAVVEEFGECGLYDSSRAAIDTDRLIVAIK